MPVWISAVSHTDIHTHTHQHVCVCLVRMRDARTQRECDSLLERNTRTNLLRLRNGERVSAMIKHACPGEPTYLHLSPHMRITHTQNKHTLTDTHKYQNTSTHKRINTQILKFIHNHNKNTLTSIYRHKYTYTFSHANTHTHTLTDIRISALTS